INGFNSNTPGKVWESLERCSRLNEEEAFDLYFKADALISHFLHIPFPEKLTDDVWAIKWAQINWLSTQGILTIKTNE
ncbi:hypothetical protein, partial [Tenacibaculum finnmarkense]|uniref:hypothetical protein n=1 Tax=Tenacibaculum finnmarkense TaxID=2781243 RepID=UPI001356716C